MARVFSRPALKTHTIIKKKKKLKRSSVQALQNEIFQFADGFRNTEPTLTPIFFENWRKN